MPHHPARFDIQLPQPAAAEAAARRRMRGLETAWSAVLHWDVRVAALQAPGADGRPYAARVQAGVIGGDTLRGEGAGSDALAALRLAFNALEAQLITDQEHARARAADWLSTVKRRLAPSPPAV